MLFHLIYVRTIRTKIDREYSKKDINAIKFERPNRIWQSLILLLTYNVLMFVCLFVCLGFFVQLKNFSLIWRRQYCWWRDVNFNLCSAFMVIELWGFFCVPHILSHGASVHTGHLRGPVTLTHIAERFNLY